MKTVFLSIIFFGTLPIAANGESDFDINFNRDIRPILSDKCFQCHGPDAKKRKGGLRKHGRLRLDTEEGALMDIGGYAALVPGNPDESELYYLVTTEDEDDRMPPREQGKDRLEDSEIALLKRWIEEGGNYAGHWAYQKITRPDVPEIDAKGFTLSNPIDHFVAERLISEGLTQSPEADRRTLIRRLSFDLTGLPPMPEEVHEFLSDKRPDAYGRLVDRLLASPHYGERMAVPWLDAVRFADTVGYHSDWERDVSPYRDYIIDSFNRDLPFDQFTIEQLAGDLLPDATLRQQVAASYNRINQISKEGGIQDAEYLAKYQAERVRTTATVWLGSTLACAECHDHKFDPFTTRDFYSFAAFFGDILEKGAWNNDGNYQEDIEKFKSLPGISFGVWGPVFEVPDPGDGSDSTQQSRFTLATISATPREIRILPRGNWTDKSGEVVLPSTPAFLPSAISSTPDQRFTRLDLARWIVDPDNPLTARTVANRLWAQFFGAAISPNTGDLGSQGQWPTHPELLDWLAVELIENGWSIKHLVRTIVLSNTYRQTSEASPGLIARDPGNRLLARQSHRRLDAEFIRDNALALAGLLDYRVGGRSARPYQPSGYYRNLQFPERTYEPDSGRHQYRRGVYTHWQRTFLHPMLKNFDAPSREECTVDRLQSNTPLQALNLLNDPSFIEAARAYAEKTLKQADDSNAISYAFERALARPPGREELIFLREFYQREMQRYRNDPAAAQEFLAIGQSPVAVEEDSAEMAAMTSVTRVILNLHETVTRN